MTKIHICENCGLKYFCPDKDPCNLPVKFGNCSEKCKWESVIKKQARREWQK